MYALLRFGCGLMIGMVTLLSSAIPASAAPSAKSTVATVPAGEVTGQPWSAPAFPVHCEQQQNQVSCTPTNPAQVKATACYIGVLVSGQAATVCTTYDGNHDALKMAGGSPALVDFGCSFGDIVCGTFENWGRGAALISTALMYSVLAAARFDVGGNLWNAAAGEWSFWAWATLIVVFVAMIWAITAAVISGERDQLVSALVRSFLAIPAVPLTFWLTGNLVQAIDGLTQDLISRRGGSLGLFATLQSVMWAGGQAGYVFGLMIFGLICLGMLLLLGVFLFRNIALAALVMVGPIAWMLFPARTVGPQWVVRYISAVVVLLLTGPLTIAFLSLVVNGLATIHTIWDPAAWPYLVGLVVVAFAPFAVFGLFTFVGAVAADSIGSRLGGHAAAMGSRGARTVASIPTRLGSRPAGPPSARRGPTSRPSAGQQGPSGPAGRASTPTKPSPATASTTHTNTSAKSGTTEARQQPVTMPSQTARPSEGARR